MNQNILLDIAHAALAARTKQKIYFKAIKAHDMRRSEITTALVDAKQAESLLDKLLEQWQADTARASAPNQEYQQTFPTHEVRE